MAAVQVKAAAAANKAAVKGAAKKLVDHVVDARLVVTEKNIAVSTPRSELVHLVALEIPTLLESHIIRLLTSALGRCRGTYLTSFQEGSRCIIHLFQRLMAIEVIAIASKLNINQSYPIMKLDLSSHASLMSIFRLNGRCRSTNPSFLLANKIRSREKANSRTALDTRSIESERDAIVR